MSNPAGWYQQPDGRQRYWDGQQWTSAWAPGVEAALTPEVGEVPPSAGTDRADLAYNGPPSSPPRKISKRIAIGVVAALVVIGSMTGLAMKVSHDNQVTTQRVAAAQARERVAAAAKAKSDAAAAAATAKQAADDQTRTERKAAVGELEAAILKDAKERVTSGTLTGPIFSASCTALGGGSADDLTALTGTFECIAVNEKKADGSSSGYRFSATINWGKNYTWHLGS